MTTDYDRACDKAGADLAKRMVEAVERARPLCPDHRDKQRGKPCLACRIETLERQNASMRTALKFYANRGNWKSDPDVTGGDLRVFHPPTQVGPAHGWEVAEITLKGASK